MKYKKFFNICCLFLLIILVSTNEVRCQISDNAILFKIDDEVVNVKEFTKVYQKNLDLVKDPSQKDIDNYLDLYINYKLKVKEARRLGYDKEISYQREFTSYKNQLSNNYLLNNKVTETLLKEAYDRLSEEVKAVHILKRLESESNDTLAVYNTLLDLRSSLKNDDFNALRAELHDGESTFVEDLGYFTAFKMVYPFETATYKLQIGEVSMPFRTQFGYHIVKLLDKRKSRGEVTVSHIMISDNGNDASNDAEKRIEEIHNKLEQGESFEILAKQFSDDKGTSDKGGRLDPFEGGQLSSLKFEDIAFSLKKPGEISKPFKTEFGWHIVRLENKTPLQSFSEIRPQLEVKVSRDSRSALIDDALLNDIRSLYELKVHDDQLNYISGLISKEYFHGHWQIPDSFNAKPTLAEIDSTTINNEEFVKYLLYTQAKYKGKNVDLSEIVGNEFNRFLDSRLLDFHKNNLENVDDDFAFVLKEYKEGLLLFNLMEKEIWNKAGKDTIGLKQFFESHRELYRHPKRYIGTVVTSAVKANLIQALEMTNNGTALSEVAKQLNKDGIQKVFLTKGEFQKDHPLLTAKLEYTTGVSSIYELEDGYAFADFETILAAGPKSFEESRGKVIGDYQIHLENSWIEDLKKRYKVTINKDALEAVKKHLNNVNG